MPALSDTYTCVYTRLEVRLQIRGPQRAVLRLVPALQPEARLQIVQVGVDCSVVWWLSDGELSIPPPSQIHTHHRTGDVLTLPSV